ncbi:MAG: InlB B-repeat-containing protein, partial [Coprobacillus sp.]
NGGMVDQKSTIPTIEVPFNEVYGTLPNPQKLGFTFSGWQYNGTMIQNDTKVTMNGEHTLKAIWK